MFLPKISLNNLNCDFLFYNLITPALDGQYWQQESPLYDFLFFFSIGDIARECVLTLSKKNLNKY